MKSGIYCIQNIINGKIYIGSTSDLRARKNSHLYYLRRGIHANKHLQSSWNKYGEENFIYYVIEECGMEETFKREQEFVDALSPEYNIRKEVLSNRGFKHTEDTREKISTASKQMWKKNSKKFENRNKIPILCYTSKGDFVREYSSTKEAAEDLGIVPTNITHVLKGKGKVIKGYFFKYKEGYQGRDEYKIRQHLLKKGII